MWVSVWVVFTNNGHYHPHTIVCQVINVHHTQLMGFMSVLLQAQRAAVSSPSLAGGEPTHACVSAGPHDHTGMGWL